MSTKLSFLSRAAVVAGIVAISGLPALAQGTQPAAPPTANVPAPASTQTTAPVASQSSGKVEDKAHKGKAHTAKKHEKLVKTAKSDTGHKPAPAVKAEEPATIGTSK